MAFAGAYKRWLHEVVSTRVGVRHHRVLGELGHHGPMIMNALGAELQVTPRYVTALVDSLEADGLVRRTPHPNDRRATIVELTEEGRTLYECGAVVFDDANRRLLATLTVEQQADLLGCLETLLEEIGRQRAGGEAGSDGEGAAQASSRTGRPPTRSARARRTRFGSRT